MSEDKFETVKFILEIKKRVRDNAVWSSHRPMTPGDRERMGKWPSGGLVHVAHALLSETLRREAYTMAISILSAGTTIEELKQKELEHAVRAHISEMLNRFVKGACEDAIERIKRDERL